MTAGNELELIAVKSCDSVGCASRRQNALATYFESMKAFRDSSDEFLLGFFASTSAFSYSQRAFDWALPQREKNSNTLGSHARTSSVALRTLLTCTPNCL